MSTLICKDIPAPMDFRLIPCMVFIAEFIGFGWSLLAIPAVAV